MSQHRLRSAVVWGAVVAQMLSILLGLGLISLGISQQIHQIATASLQLLVLFGVLNNPTNRTRF